MLLNMFGGLGFIGTPLTLRNMTRSRKLIKCSQKRPFLGQRLVQVRESFHFRFPISAFIPVLVGSPDGRNFDKDPHILILLHMLRDEVLPTTFSLHFPISINLVKVGLMELKPLFVAFP